MNNNFQPISFYFYGDGATHQSVFMMKITICLYLNNFCYKHKLYSAGEVLFIENYFSFYVIVRRSLRIFFSQKLKLIENDKINYCSVCWLILSKRRGFLDGTSRRFSCWRRKKSAKFKFAVHKRCSGMYAWVSELRVR